MEWWLDFSAASHIKNGGKLTRSTCSFPANFANISPLLPAIFVNHSSRHFELPKMAGGGPRAGRPSYKKCQKNLGKGNGDAWRSNQQIIVSPSQLETLESTMLPRRLIFLFQLALASAFSGTASLSKTRGQNVVQAGVLGCSGGGDGGDGYHDVGYHHKSSHIVSIKSSNIAGMINDGDDTYIEVDFGPEACLVAVTGER